MKIRLLSDLHLEFGMYEVEPMETDKDTVLVLAGDITVASHDNYMLHRFTPFIQRCSQQFKRVVMVCGNHEYYNSKFLEVVPKLQKLLEHLQLYNVHILHNDSVTVEDTVFIGGTLWTDCGSKESADPKAGYLWHGMSDSTCIKYGRGGFSIQNVRKEHLATREYVLAELEAAKSCGYKTVLVVHHSVSSKSVPLEYKNHSLNMFYYSSMELELADVNPNLVLHGHTHHAQDYTLAEAICETRVVCNPRGYHGYESSPEARGFKPKLLLEI